MSMIEMKVEGIGIDPQNNPLVLLRDEERSLFIPIWVGISEAVSIQMQLDDRASQRPMTHDLISHILHELDAQLIKVTLNDFSDSIYYASLHLQIGSDSSEIQQLDARPSDAIALALRAQCGIFVSTEVSEKAGIQVEEIGGSMMHPSSPLPEEEKAEELSPSEIEKFTRLLEGVDLHGDPENN